MIKKHKPLKGLLYKAFLLTMMTGALHAGAQEKTPSVRWGIAVPLAAKLQLLPVKSATYNFWGNAAVSVVSEIKGQEENDLSLLIKAGISLDVTQYKMPAYGWYVINRANILINPEVLFPTRFARFKVAAGIGVEWNFYFLSQLDNAEITTAADAYAQVREANRKANPFLSAGLQYDLKQGFYLQLFVRQAMMNYFEAGTELDPGAHSNLPPLRLGERPTYIGLCGSYFFR